MTATTEHTTTTDPNAALAALLPEIQRVMFLPAADPDRVAVMAEKARVLALIKQPAAVAETTEATVINGAVIPPAPPCPDWCQKYGFQHPALGWDRIERVRGGFTVEKQCEQIFLDVRRSSPWTWCIG